MTHMVITMKTLKALQLGATSYQWPHPSGSVAIATYDNAAMLTLNVNTFIICIYRCTKFS